MSELANGLLTLPSGELSVRLILTLLHFLWQGAAIGIVAVGGARLLRNASSSTRYGLDSVLLLCMPLLAVVTFTVIDPPPVPQPSVAIALEDSRANAPEEPSARPAPVPISVAAVEIDLSPASSVVDASVGAIPPANTSTNFDYSATLILFAPWFAVAYSLTVICFLLRLSLALWGGHRLRTLSKPLTDSELIRCIQVQAERIGLGVVPLVVYCERVTVPTVIGVLRPVILVPASIMTGLTVDEFSAVISHELAHIRRYDLWLNLMQRVIESLLFFHPVVWFLSRRLSTEREICCDDLVVQAGHPPMNYAQALLRMAEHCVRVDKPALASLAAGGHSPAELERRITRLMNFQEPSKLRLTRAGVIIVLGLLVATAAAPAMMSLFAQSPPTNETLAGETLTGETPTAETLAGETLAGETLAGETLTGDDNAVEEPADPAANTRAAEHVIRFPHCIVASEHLEPRPLAEAIRSFNEAALESPIGQRQPPITEEEARDAIGKHVAQLHITKSVREQFSKILQTGTLPPKAYFRRFTRFDDEQQMQRVWWVRLCLEGDDPPLSSVAIRTTQLSSRPYTQLERRQYAASGVMLINRFSSYFKTAPSMLRSAEFPADKKTRLLKQVETSLQAKDVKSFESLFDWQNVDASIRTFVRSEFQTLVGSKIHGIKITPRKFAGELIHWSAYQHYQPNLAVIGYLEIQYTADAAGGLKRTLSLEMGDTGTEFQLINYIESGDRVLPKGRVVGMSMRGHNEQLADGTFLTTSLITNPGSLISAHLANEEIWLRDYNHTKQGDQAAVDTIRWGAPVAGLRLGIRPADFAKRKTRFRPGDWLRYEVWLKNETDEVIHVPRDPRNVARPAVSDKGINLLGHRLWASFDIPLEDLDAATLSVGPGEAKRIASPQSPISAADAPVGRFGPPPLRLSPRQYRADASTEIHFLPGGSFSRQRTDGKNIGLHSGSTMIDVLPAAQLQIREVNELTATRTREFVAADPSSRIIEWTGSNGQRREVVLRDATEVLVDDDDLASATVVANEHDPPNFSIELELKSDVVDWFAQLTKQLCQRTTDRPLLGIFLNGELLSAPRLLSPITRGKAVITGNFTQAQAEQIASQLSPPETAENNRNPQPSDRVQPIQAVAAKLLEVHRDWTLQHCDQEPSVEVDGDRGYKIVLRRTWKEYTNIPQQQVGGADSGPFDLRSEDWQFVLVPASSPNAPSKLRSNIPWQESRSPYHTRNVWMGEGFGFTWFTHGTLIGQEIVREKLDLKGGDDRLQLMIAGMRVKDTHSMTANSCQRLIARFGDDALPAIQQAIEKTPDGEDLWKLVGSLAYIRTENATALLRRLYVSELVWLRQAAARSLIYQPFRQEAKLEYLDMLRKRLYVDSVCSACLEFQWIEAVPILKDLESRPDNLRELSSTTLARRTLQGQPIPQALRTAQQAIRASVNAKDVQDPNLAKQRTLLIESPDTEAVTLLLIELAIFQTKGNVQRINEAGIELLKARPRQTTVAHLQAIINGLPQENRREAEKLLAAISAPAGKPPRAASQARAMPLDPFLSGPSFANTNTTANRIPEGPRVLVATIFGTNVHLDQLTRSEQETDPSRLNDAQRARLLAIRGESLLRMISQRAVEDYIRREKLAVSEEMKRRLWEIVQQQDLPPFVDASTFDEGERRKMVFVMSYASLKDWVVCKSLYERYGGRVGIGSLGLWIAVDGRNALMREYFKSERIQIHDAELEKAFWKAANKPNFADAYPQGEQLKRLLASPPHLGGDSTVE